jgi:hypothetical protein
MKPIPVIAPPKKPAPRARKTRRREIERSTTMPASGSGPQPDSGRTFLHDVVNQLTVISLACFELHDPTDGTWNESQRKAIDAIEAAVHSAAELIERLAKLLTDQSAKQATSTPLERSSAPTHPANNVYPISPHLNHR